MKATDLLIPFGKLYGAIIDARNTLYERGRFKSHHLGAKTISIGNITTGGTGKTPLTALTANILAAEGEKVCILSRGYGRSSKGRVLVSDKTNVLVDAQTGGDEPVELAERLLRKAIVIADADRVSAAAWAKENFDVSVFILDDGFQHRRAARDIDIVCIDATKAVQNDRVLPAGNLREDLKHLSRADAFVITRSDLASEDKVAEIKFTLRKYNPKATTFTSSTKINGLRRLNGDATVANGELKFLAFCGIGNPETFYAGLRQHFELNGSATITSTLAFADHHKYGIADIEQVEKNAKAAGCKALITTAKDAVKLGSFSFTMPCYIAEIETVIDDLEAFRSMIAA